MGGEWHGQDKYDYLIKEADDPDVLKSNWDGCQYKSQIQGLYGPDIEGIGYVSQLDPPSERTLRISAHRAALGLHWRAPPRPHLPSLPRKQRMSSCERQRQPTGRRSQQQRCGYWQPMDRQAARRERQALDLGASRSQSRRARRAALANPTSPSAQPWTPMAAGAAQVARVDVVEALVAMAADPVARRVAAATVR